MTKKFDYLYHRENVEFVSVVVNDDGSTTESEIDIRKNPSQSLITDGCISLKKVDSKTMSYLCIKTAQKNDKNIMIQ